MKLNNQEKCSGSAKCYFLLLRRDIREGKLFDKDAIENMYYISVQQ
jgi:hypothetical protein